MTKEDPKQLLAGEAAFERLSEYARDQELRWFVAYGESLIKPRDPNAPPPSTATRIRWRLNRLVYGIEAATEEIRWWAAERLRWLADRIQY